MRDFLEVVIPTLIVFVVGATLLGVLGVLGVFSIDSSIVTDEPFKVIGDTSNYSCIVSEVESELLLNCLKVK